jgi:hypothetical protein
MSIANYTPRRRPRGWIAWLIVLAGACLCLLLSGCAFSLYRDKPNGRWLLRATLGTDQQVGAFEMRKDGGVKLGGVKTDQSASTGHVADAAATAIKPTLLP